MTEPDFASLLRQLSWEAQALQAQVRSLLLFDAAQAVVNARTIQDVSTRLAVLSCRLERLAGFAESAQNLPPFDELRSS